MAIDFQGWALCSGCLLILACSSSVFAHRLRRSRLALTRAQARLRARTERHKLTLRACNDVILCWNVRSGRVRCSANGQRYFGTPPRPTDAWRLLQRCVDEQDRERVRRELQRFLAGNGDVWENEFTLQGPDSARVPVRVRGVLVREPSGEPRKMVVALSDMTDAWAARDAARALARAARLATIGEVTAGITHEVTQPLGAILNNAETGLFLLQKKRPPLATIRTILEDIRNDDLRASQVVRRTRALLQNREMVREPVNLNAVLAEAVDLLWMQARRRGIKLSLLPGDIPSISADPVHLQQVIINLIGNALDATEVDVTGARRVDVLSDHVDGRVRVSVRDSGCGIAPEHLETIFESFHSGKANGLGLGLSIARAIVKAHGGRIFAENNLHGPGATVCFEIPEPVDASTPLFSSPTLLVRQAAD
ncbi:sensor histidine kinase [Peristeroidobacter soli]|uniref:sensor histidine kinase n=1 Tax=Peristeroidobacter soli TaxID=2497877 RepID=UPI00101DD4E0|nr:HAMP domain-containing sensor histidine kinase [Peristeroidobacter soli]